MRSIIAFASLVVLMYILVGCSATVQPAKNPAAKQCSCSLVGTKLSYDCAK